VPHLFGGERALLADMAGRLARAGFTARLALAETMGGAHALARYARNASGIVPDGEIAAALAPLPIEALRLESEIVTLLKRLGLKRIGQLYALPRTSLERRFHAKETAEAVLLRLDQALGRRKEPRVPLLPSPDFVARRPFPEPLITHEGVVGALDHLASALCAKLARAGRGCRRLALWVARADGSSTVIEAGLSAPSREPSHLLRLIEDKIQDLDMGFGVDLMSLAALVTETLPPAQTSLTQGSGKEAAEPLIDRLINRLGARSVRRLFPKASHIPELAQTLKSAFAGPSFWPEPVSPKPNRPPLLFARPEPLTVLAEIPEGPPARFTWRHVSRRVIKAEGPERIAPEWWRELRQQRSLAARPRDYYRIEDEDGHRYWVFREGLYQESAGGAPGWYLHGVFG
jgi:protein ImuB